jgi:hypothetical protein
MEIGDHIRFKDVDSKASAFNCQLYGALRQVPFIRVDHAWCPFTSVARDGARLASGAGHRTRGSEQRDPGCNAPR